MKLIWGLLAVCSLGLVAGPAEASRVSASMSPANGTEELIGFEQTRKCAAEKKRLAVAFLVDESSSIKKADPKNLRVRAVTRAISRLSLSLAAVSSR